MPNPTRPTCQKRGQPPCQCIHVRGHFLNFDHLNLCSFPPSQVTVLRCFVNGYFVPEGRRSEGALRAGGGGGEIPARKRGECAKAREWEKKEPGAANQPTSQPAMAWMDGGRARRRRPLPPHTKCPYQAWLKTGFLTNGMFEQRGNNLRGRTNPLFLLARTLGMCAQHQWRQHPCVRHHHHRARRRRRRADIHSCGRLALSLLSPGDGAVRARARLRQPAPARAGERES